MEINSKDDLINVIKELQAENVALNERIDSMGKTESEETETETEDTETEETEETEEDIDEIEKLLFEN